MGKVDKAKTFVGDTPARASEVNTVFDDIYNEFNGDIDEYNLNLERTELIHALAEVVGDVLLPIGSKYTNFEDDTNPEDLFGFGTWERIAEGRVIIGVDEDDSDFDTSEATGGEKEHTLTEDEMPEHDHSGSTSTDGEHDHTIKGHGEGSTSSNFGSTSWPSCGFGEEGTFNSDVTSDEGDHNHSISSSGGGESHNNLQPYITAYIWKRTA